jgi:RimJ/RimL family protein N-acetyltransferase
LSDAAIVRTLAGNRAIADTTLNVPHPYEDGMAEAWIATHEPRAATGELLPFAMTLAADSALIGAISLKVDVAFSRAELGYWVGEPYWGQGYCTEAATTVVHYAFSELKLHRVHASYLARNPASGRVLAKIGMLHEGVARQHTRKWGQFEDLVLCGLLQSDAL